jgi:hypothetical protein
MMSQEGRASPELRKAVARMVYEFREKWPSKQPLTQTFMDWYADLLHDFTVDEIDSLIVYCVDNRRKPPVPVELIELRNRMRSGKPLADPIVSMVERIAYLVLTSDEFANSKVSMSDIMDGCLIAAAIAHVKSYQGINLEVSAEFMAEEMAGRARMFATEAEDWRLDADEGKGYWAPFLKPPQS